METLSPGTFFAWEEATREAFAAEVRDGLLQTLTALAMDAGWLRDHAGDGRDLQARLATMLALLQEAVGTTEAVATGLRPLVSDPCELAPALESLAAAFTRRTGAACTLDVDESLALPESGAVALFRTVQDWMHATRLDRAGPLRIRVAQADHGAVLRIREAHAVPPLRGTMRAQALAVVRERVHLLGGSVRLAPTEDGTAQSLEVRLPRQPIPASA